MQCPDCGSVPDEPALCLLCGKLCSPSWKPCCRRVFQLLYSPLHQCLFFCNLWNVKPVLFLMFRAGKCLNHASQCGAGVGIFLLVRVCVTSSHFIRWSYCQHFSALFFVISKDFVGFDSCSLQKTTILLQRSARLAFWPSLYLDAFGEEVLDLLMNIFI